MAEPKHGLRVLFNVQVCVHWMAYCWLHQSVHGLNCALGCAQEFVSGGSLDRRIWNQPSSSVTWEEKLQWCKDTAKVRLLQLAHDPDLIVAGNGLRTSFRLRSSRLKKPKCVVRHPNRSCKGAWKVCGVCLTLGGQIADFGTAGKSTSQSPSINSTTETDPSVRCSIERQMSSALGTGAACSTCTLSDLHHCACCVRIPVQWMAPELCYALDSPGTNLSKYGFHVDQYSYGCA